MAEWTKEEPTHELRYRRRFEWGETTPEVTPFYALQQKWKVTRGGTGDGVKETYEWRDVPTVEGE